MKTRSFWLGYVAGIATGIVTAIILLIKLSTLPPAVLADYSFTDLQGNKVEPVNLKGKAIVLNLWATWCGPCVHEMPALEKAQKLLNNSDVIFLVASDEPLNRIEAFKKRMGLTIPLYSYRRLSNVQWNSGLPATFIYDRTGRIVYSRVGAISWDDPSTIEKLRSYLR